MQQDLKDWTSYAGVGLQWPEAFPLRTVLPLRVTLAAGCPPQLIHALCRQQSALAARYITHLLLYLQTDSAAWRENKDIGQEEVDPHCSAGVWYEFFSTAGAA